MVIRGDAEENLEKKNAMQKNTVKKHAKNREKMQMNPLIYRKKSAILR